MRGLHLPGLRVTEWPCLHIRARERKRKRGREGGREGGRVGEHKDVSFGTK